MGVNEISDRNKKKQGKRVGPGAATLLILAGLVCLALLIRLFLIGRNVTLFNPQGSIANQQHNLFVMISVLLCAVAVPVVLFLYFIAWKFRESNTKVIHRPTVRDSKRLLFTIWAYPIVAFFIFAAILIPATHKLEPRKALAGSEPITIQVIALRWKWVFLYPEQKIASVNYVQLPVDRPVKFELTADNAPMSSFWIPNLGGQLYAMTGHVNPLNLMPDKIGEYPGSAAEINGDGLADMTFKTNVTTQSDFDGWVEATRASGSMLDTATYDKLVQPSEANPAKYYGGYQSNLYDTVVMKYMGHAMHTEETAEHEGHE